MSDDTRELSATEASAVLRAIARRVGKRIAVKAMPAAEVLTASQVAHAEAMAQVTTLMAESLRRCKALESED